MKKLIATMVLGLCLIFSSSYAQQLEYTGFLKTVLDMDGFAIINEKVYEPGDVIKDSVYKLITIERDYVLLEDVNTKERIKISFKLGNKPIDN